MNKIEKIKAEKDGLDVLADLDKFAEEGWESIDKKDLERLKWLGIFFRPKTPGQFMVRMRIPGGCLTSKQFRVLAACLPEDGTADITTRQNIQLRGIRIEKMPEVFKAFAYAGLTSIQSGMDNVRNITGSPVAGIDPDELIDTREIVIAIQDMITDYGKGNKAFSNLPRKLNIAVEGAKDNSIHAELNDISFIPAYLDGVLGFNVLVGGYLSAQRCAESIPLDVWIPATTADVVELCRTILTFYVANGDRKSRGKSRLMWLVESMGVEEFRSAVAPSLHRAAPFDELCQDKKDHLGIHPQKQEGYSYLGYHVPMGRLNAEKMRFFAELADIFGKSELRLTVEQNIIIPWIETEDLANNLVYNVPKTLSRSVISCTGAQYCSFAIIETKQRALQIAAELDEELDIPGRVRLHWTGCPNSCGQAQAGDIGLMGTKVKGKEAVKVFIHGQVGHQAKLGELAEKGIPCDELKPFLRNLLIESFGATLTSENP